MKSCLIAKNLVLCLALVFISAQGWTQEADSSGVKVEEKAKEKAKEKKKEKRSKKKAEVPPELKQYLEMMAPGPEHKALNPMAGSWDAKASYSPMPGAPVQETTATMRRRWVLGGRYLQDDYRGSFMGVRFQGIGFTGYDKIQKTYVSTWMDTMSTGILMQTGKFSKDGKTLKLVGEVIDPQTGKAKKFIRLLRIEGPDKHVDQMFEEGPDGNERLVMTITFTRRAAGKKGKQPGKADKKESKNGKKDLP